MKHLKKSYLTIALALSTCGVLFQNCAAAPPPDLAQLSSSSTAPVPAPGAVYYCSFVGRILMNNEGVDAYQSATVPAGQVCATERRVCANGTLTGSFEHAGCTVQTPAANASCNFYGKTIAHGGSVLAFQSNSVTGSSCTAENRVCSNGTLSGSYQYDYCEVNCSFNGAIVNHGATVDAYQSASVPNGSACVLEKRKCDMGTLTGSFSNSSCSVQPAGAPPPSNCIFNGQTVLHGGSVTAYSTDVAPYGTSCASYAQSRICNNGTLSGTHQFPYCQREVVDNCDGYQPRFTQFQEVRVACP